MPTPTNSVATENGLALVAGSNVAPLSQLVPITPIGEVLRVRLKRIRPFLGQPRGFFDQTTLENLARSLKIKQRLPITVKRITDDPDHDYELIDGERRFRAAQIAELEYVTIWEKPIANRDEQYVDSVISNFGRADHTPLEKAHALFRLSEMGMTQTEIADQCGYTQTWVSQHLNLLHLEPEVLALMDPSRPKEKQLGFSMALRLVNVRPELQREIANEIVNKNVPATEARFMIQTRVHESGQDFTRRKGARGRPPSKDHKIVSGFAIRLENQTKLMADMPAPMFTDMFGSRPWAEVHETVHQIESSIANLQRLIKNIRATKPEEAAA